MKPVTAVQCERLTSLVHLLADGQFHSGAELGRVLGISRAAVHKQMQGMTELGFDFHAVQGRGYRLWPAPELLTPESWQSAVARDVRVCLTLDSTNAEIMRRRHVLPNGAVVLSEHQQAGRGRRGRDWVSPPATNLYLSMLWRFEDGIETVLGLSQSVALGCLDALSTFGAHDLQVKWPNDVLWHDRKLAGILIELSGQPGEPTDVVIGVGINVAMSRHAADAIGQPWCDLQSILGTSVSRNELAARVITALRGEVARFHLHGLSPRLADWQRLDRFHHQKVRLLHGADRVTEGMVVGLDAQGALMLSTDDGVQRFLGGEVSLRGMAP